MMLLYVHCVPVQVEHHKPLTPIFDAYFYTWISKYQSSHNLFHVTNFDFALWRITVIYPPLATSQIKVAMEY